MLYEALLFSGLISFGCVVIGYFIPRKTYQKLACQIKYWYIGFVYHIQDLRNAKYNTISKEESIYLPGNIAIVTGGSRGIGAEVVKKLLEYDMQVIIACRNVAAGEKLIREIEKCNGNGTSCQGRAKVYELDNGSFDSVKKFARQIKKDYNKIHVLINNAGVMFPPEYRETEDGFEEQWAVNYLSHFLLSSLLLPLLKAGGEETSGSHSRIVNVTSCAQDISCIDFDFIRKNSKDKFNTQVAYGQSKLAQTMFTITLAKLLKCANLPVRTYAVHPGVVSTDLFRETFFGRNRWLMFAWKKPEQGAISILYAAVSKRLNEKNGTCVSNCEELTVPPQALDKETQKKLFEVSLSQVQISDFFEYLYE